MHFSDRSTRSRFKLLSGTKLAKYGPKFLGRECFFMVTFWSSEELDQKKNLSGKNFFLGTSYCAKMVSNHSSCFFSGNGTVLLTSARCVTLSDDKRRGPQSFPIIFVGSTVPSTSSLWSGLSSTSSTTASNPGVK